MPNQLLVRKIQEAVIHEQNTHYCYQLMMQARINQGFQAVPATISNYVFNVQNYIGQVSTVLDQFNAGARKAGLSQEFQPIFTTAEGLFLYPPVGIPDYLGLAGILDNAYLVFSFFLNILGQNLFYPEFVQLHYNVRNMLGEPLASQLDNLAIATANSPVVQSAIQDVAESAGQENEPENPVYPDTEDSSPEQKTSPRQSIAPLLNMMSNDFNSRMATFRSSFR